MKKEFIDLSLKLQQQGFGADDVAKLRANATAVRKSVRTARQLRDVETDVVYDVATRLFKKYPERVEMHKECEVKARRDMKLVLRYCLYSVVLNDPDWAAQKMFWWYRTILNAFEFGDNLVEDAYRMCQENCTQRMGREEAAAINAELENAISIFLYDPIAERQSA